MQLAPVAAVAAVLRAAAPAHRQGQPLEQLMSDRLAFAAHACVLAAGYRLVASGAEAASPSAVALFDAPRLPSPLPPDAALAADWCGAGEEYTFLYAPPEVGGGGSGSGGSNKWRGMLLLKVLRLGGGGEGGDNNTAATLLATLAAGGGASAPAAPQSAELPLARFATLEGSGEEGIVAGVRDLPELCLRVGGALAAATGAGGAAAARAEAAAAAAAGPSSGRRPPPERGDDDDDHDPLRVSPRMGPPRGLRVGEEDVMPFMGGGGGVPGGGGGGGGPLGPGGGMHVGPGHPFFADRMRHHPPAGRGSSLPPGARWDPIRPEGLEGWSPDDYGVGGGGPGSGGNGGRGGGGPGGRGGRGGPRVHPDVMPPGPGGGPSWDSMFG
jgi:hypothetical protein